MTFSCVRSERARPFARSLCFWRLVAAEMLFSFSHRIIANPIISSFVANCGLCKQGTSSSCLARLSVIIMTDKLEPKCTASGRRVLTTLSCAKSFALRGGAARQSDLFRVRFLCCRALPGTSADVLPVLSIDRENKQKKHLKGAFLLPPSAFNVNVISFLRR